MRFGQADHGLELPRGGGDAAVRGADVVAEFAHRDVGVCEGLGGRGGQFRVDVGLCVGDVGGEEFDWLVGYFCYVSKIECVDG